MSVGDILKSDGKRPTLKYAQQQPLQESPIKNTKYCQPLKSQQPRTPLSPHMLQTVGLVYKLCACTLSPVSALTGGVSAAKRKISRHSMVGFQQNCRCFTQTGSGPILTTVQPTYFLAPILHAQPSSITWKELNLEHF